VGIWLRAYEDVLPLSELLWRGAKEMSRTEANVDVGDCDKTSPHGGSFRHCV
jgi:hypothetical protein